MDDDEIGEAGIADEELDERLREENGMTQETGEKTEVAAPTLGDLEAKVGRLEAQVSEDTGKAQQATDAFSSAVKKGDVDKALELADTRTTAQATLAKSTSQLATAKNAVISGKRAANAGAIAETHSAGRQDKSLVAFFQRLRELGVEWTKVEFGETGNLVFNSGGAEVKRARGAGGGGTGKRGEPLTVDGTEYASASAANRSFFPESGPLNRESIVSKLVNAGHEVS